MRGSDSQHSKHHFSSRKKVSFELPLLLVDIDGVLVSELDDNIVSKEAIENLRFLLSKKQFNVVFNSFRSADDNVFNDIYSLIPESKNWLKVDNGFSFSSNGFCKKNNLLKWFKTVSFEPEEVFVLDDEIYDDQLEELQEIFICDVVAIRPDRNNCLVLSDLDNLDF